MGNWYRVVKTIKGHRYVYEQQTYREGSHVRTRNRYLGPAGSHEGSSSSLKGESEPSGQPAGIASALIGGLADFGKAAIQQFDVPRWGTDAATQLGLTGAGATRTKKTVTTTTHRKRQRRVTVTETLYDPEDVSPAGRIKTAATEKVFARIPDGTTDPRGYIVKRQGSLFPTEKFTQDLRAYLDVDLASDGSIIEGVNVNKISFTQKVAFHNSAKQHVNSARSRVTTTDASSTSPPPDATHSPDPSDFHLRSDAHRKYFTGEQIRITKAGDVVQLCREMLATGDAIDRDKEHYYVIHLNVRSRVSLIEVVSVGTVSASQVHPRETFRRAIAEGASSIIIAHNHPSGEVDPSDNDTMVTKTMFDAGQIIGINVLDHIVFSDSKAFSFRDNKTIE
jgi:hypothetical protein